MRVRMFTTPLLWFGGGEVQFLQTYQHFLELGVDVSALPVDMMKRPDIVHFFGSYGKQYRDLSKYCRDNQIPYVVSTIFGVSNATLKNRVFNRFSKLMLRRKALESMAFRRFAMLPEFLNGAEALLPNTHAEAELLSEYFPRLTKKMRIIPNGVEEGFRAGDETMFRARLNISGDYILNVARLEPRKNQHRLIQAVKLLGSNAPQLVLVGDSSVDLEYTQVCQMAAQGARVVFAGHIGHDDPLLRGAYAGANIFALPSYQETPGISALEAYIAGAKVVITEIGGAKEYLGGAAEYVNPMDVDDIASKLRKVYESGVRGTSEREADEFLARFSWRSVAQQTLHVYESVLNGGTP